MNVSSWLTNSQIDRLDAELIMARAIGKDRTFLHAHPDYEFSAAEFEQIKSDTLRRQKHEPLAYILGEKEFYGRIFTVTPDTLIPRPETEALIDIIKAQKPHKVLDVGTGSGCIAVTLALELPKTEVNALDISQKALKIARQNAQNLGAKVNFFESNLLENAQKYDLIVANLPYVDQKWDWLSPELAYEPKTALFAEDGGLELIKKLIKQAPTHLEKQGKLILEADISQHQKIADFATSNSFEIIPSDRQNLALCLALSD